MNKFTRINTILSLSMLVLVVMVIKSCMKSEASEIKEISTSPKSYYFDESEGNDSNTGESMSASWKSLGKIRSLDLNPGDKIYLAKSTKFTQPIELFNQSGSEETPILITTYNTENHDLYAHIDTKDHLNAIHIKDCNYIIVKKLKISANPSNSHESTTNKEMRCGILIKPERNGITQHITLENLLISDVFYEKAGFTRPSKEVNSPNGTQNYGWGIRVINSNTSATIKNITIKNCVVENVAHTGIKFTGKSKNIKDISVDNCTVLKTGGPGIQMSNVENGHVLNNNVNFSGSNDDSRKWGRGSGLWTWGSENIIIEKNRFTNANGPGDSAGCHIDFNCNDIVVQYNYSANNAGGFCEILGNNYNCAYRYNISVNDGHRIKGQNGAFQEGKTFWLSGYAGSGNPRTGPFNSYFYNNTIYTKPDLVSKYAVDKATSGVLVMNNIFYIEGESKLVLGDQYTPDEGGESQIAHIVFKNNLYLKAENWPDEVLIQDSAPLFGNAQFKNKGGYELSDYAPENEGLIIDKGMNIPRIPNDQIGLKIGLEVEKDILGNSIQGLPDLGAVELGKN